MGGDLGPVETNTPPRAMSLPPVPRSWVSSDEDPLAPV